MLFVQRTEVAERCFVGSEAIRVDLFSATMTLHQFLQKFHYGSLVSTFGGEVFQHLALMIYGPPQVVTFAIHLHKNLVDVQFLVGKA